MVPSTTSSLTRRYLTHLVEACAHCFCRAGWRKAAVEPCQLALHLPLPIHFDASLGGTATCRPSPRRVDGLASHPLAARRTFYARSWMRTSQNTPSRDCLESARRT